MPVRIVVVPLPNWCLPWSKLRSLPPYNANVCSQVKAEKQKIVQCLHNRSYLEKLVVWVTCISKHQCVTREYLKWRWRNYVNGCRTQSLKTICQHITFIWQTYYISSSFFFLNAGFWGCRPSKRVGEWTDVGPKPTWRRWTVRTRTGRLLSPLKSLSLTLSFLPRSLSLSLSDEDKLAQLEKQMDDAIVETAKKRRTSPKQVLRWAVRALKAERQLAVGATRTSSGLAFKILDTSLITKRIPTFLCHFFF